MNPSAAPDQTRKLNGIVYTPSKLANFVAKKVIGYYFHNHLKRTEDTKTAKIHNLRILDPACGNGELLIAMWKQLNLISVNREYNSLEMKHLNPISVLCGIDMDNKAARVAKLRINELSNTTSNKVLKSRILNTNALFPFDYKDTMKGWLRIFKLFNAPKGFDILIANPPWGADTSSYRNKLSSKHFSLFKRQFDTSDLFIELALKIVKPEGYFAFIIPDSLFSLERADLRRLILDNTTIRFIGRFGEKLFENINRACAIIICQNKSRKSKIRTECLRLTHEARRKILENSMSFEKANRLLNHKVLQERFEHNPGYRFDIDISVKEEKTIRKFNSLFSKFGDFLQSSRGVELSKNGMIYKCYNCNLWMPLPKVIKKRCPHCKEEILIDFSKSECIVSNEFQKEYHPFLVGESIRRYFIDSKLWIDTNKKGIKYKDHSLYESPKLLVRKTGVGILAAMDYSHNYTNQVVYILRQRENIEHSFPLELFLGIINSRAMYYYLVKNHGETEWRSHPYLTQTQLLNLPIPRMDILINRESETVNQIVKTVKKFSTKNKEISIEADAIVESFVAKLYNLEKNDYELVYSTLSSVEELLPIRVLKRIKIEDIFN